jgi:2-phosphosulfolactate phosphatase
MQVSRVTPLQAAQARGVVIVIDVIRAFTVAAYAFGGDASRLWLVRTVEEAQALRARNPQALLAGEIGGRLIDGFDFNNSPSQIAAADIRGRVIIQRTGAGTQGAVNAVNSTHLLLCSLTNARATAFYARRLAESAEGLVTLFPTAAFEDSYRDEDDVCADYVEALLQGRDSASEVLAEGIAYLHAIERFQWFEPDSSDAPFADVAAILATDYFNFAMVGTRRQWRDITYVDVKKRYP